MIKTLAATLSLLFVVGCGGGSTLSPGVDGNKPVNQLSDPEIQTVCMDVQSQPVIKEEECRLLGLLVAASGASSSTTDADLQSTCASGYSQCEDPTGGGDGGVSISISCTRPGASCTATVAQLTACENELIAMPDPIPPCNELTRAKVLTLALSGAAAIMIGPACQAYLAACPASAGAMPGAPII